MPGDTESLDAANSERSTCLAGWTGNRGCRDTNQGGTWQAQVAAGLGWGGRMGLGKKGQLQGKNDSTL